MSDELSGQEICPRLRIVIDDREPHVSIAAALKDCGCTSIEVRRLGIGDYVVNDALLVERKSLGDLIVSIIDGRLFQQAKHLAEAELPAAMIFEGTARDIEHGEMRWEAIQGAIVSVSLFFGIPVLRTRTLEETARTLLYAARQNSEVETNALVRHATVDAGVAAVLDERDRRVERAEDVVGGVVDGWVEAGGGCGVVH